MPPAAPFVDLTLSSDDELPAVSSTQLRAANASGPDFTGPGPATTTTTSTTTTAKATATTRILPYHSPSPHKPQRKHSHAFDLFPPYPRNALHHPHNAPHNSHNGLLLPGALPAPIEVPGAPPPPKLHVPVVGGRRGRAQVRELSLSPNAARSAGSAAKRRKVAVGAVTSSSSSPAAGGRQERMGTSSSLPGGKETRILPPGMTQAGRGGGKAPAPTAMAARREREVSVYDMLQTQARPVMMSRSDAEPQLSGVPGAARAQPGLNGTSGLNTGTTTQEAGGSNAGPGVASRGPTTKAMKRVLRKVIFPQIHICLERLGTGLDGATKKKVGWDTATKLSERGGELETLLAGNDGELSETVRKWLVEECAVLVRFFVFGYKSGSSSNSNNSSPKSKLAAPHPVARGRQTAAQRQAKQAAVPPQEPIVITESESEEDENDFHDAVETMQAGATGQKRDSSSPSTSYTVESPGEDAVLEPTPQLGQKAKGLRQGTLDFASRRSPALRKLAGTGARSPVKRTGGGNPVQKRTRAAGLHSVAKQALLGEVEVLRMAGNGAQRPYLSLSARRDVARGLEVGGEGMTVEERRMLRDHVVHVDFASEEVQYVRDAMDAWRRYHDALKPAQQLGGLISASAAVWRRYQVESKPQGLPLGLINGSVKISPSLLQMIMKPPHAFSHLEKGSRLIKLRSEESVQSFLEDFGMDIWRGYLSGASKFSTGASAVLRVAPKPREFGTGTISNNHDSVSAILRDRELSRGTVGRAHRSTKARILSSMDDAIVRQIEFTGCSGDIATITWLPSDKFVCGAITHSDESNQQYNKPGNLALGSVEKSSLRSVSGHRIIRPIVEKGSNALESMRETQDPYLYCSVTATAFHEGSQKALTGSFDKTVKVWDINPDGSGMTLCGTWHHGGVINFVVTSPHHSKIATASDVFSDAIRVYDLNEDDVSNSSFVSYSGSRADEQTAQQLRSRQSWVYYPSTLQWGKAPSVAHLLLAGYSPRSFNVHEEVPKLIEDTGELCLWDTNTGSRVLITSARTQNVFEVVWHPTWPIFVAATSATGEHEDGVRTQLRIFCRTDIGTFSHTKTFDCRAVDINEITLMSNSPSHCYVTASCTDGNTYIWDSAQEEKPIHVLEHGKSIDDQTLDDAETKDDDHEKVDSGVKFAAWGRTVDRFFTGSSDGVVKAWNVRAPSREVHVADVITLSGGISAGAFSSDHSRLLIGDATGKLNVLKCGDLDGFEESPPRRRQQPIIPHYEATRSTADKRGDLVEPSPEPTAREMAQRYIDAGQVIIHPDPYVGAVQGNNYLDTGLFCRQLHQDGDPLSEPLEEVVRSQQMRYKGKSLAISTTRDIEPCPEPQHQKNYMMDLQPEQLDPQTAAELQESGVDFRFNDEHLYEYEPDLGVSEEASEDEEDAVDMVDDSPCGGDGVFLSRDDVDEAKWLQNVIINELQAYKALQQVKEAMVHDNMSI
ncbi:hypothetical protein V496_05716 [Pseudogymnoascus sp. VKM F-4515 (FW-2607)]|nr:hypothetical protein V496_05716 [Pseudogymnoascus sp. VKM F-4515 (FW-2607)]